MSLEYKPSLGFVETAGLVIAIQVADAMAKAAEVEIIAAHKVDGLRVCVICKGDVAACQAAVETGALLAQSLNGLNVVLYRDLGDAQTVGRILKTLGVAVRAEQLHGVVSGAVGLHALKDLLCVVEHHGSGVQFKGAVGDDAGIVPALALGVIHDEHMVGELFAEAELRLIGGLCLGRSRAGDLDIQHSEFPSFLLCACARFPALYDTNVGFYYNIPSRFCKESQNVSSFHPVSCTKL